MDIKDVELSTNSSWNKLSEHITERLWDKHCGPRSGKSFSVMSFIKDSIDKKINKYENRAKLLIKAKKYKKAYKLRSKIKLLKEFKL